MKRPDKLRTRESYPMSDGTKILISTVEYTSPQIYALTGATYYAKSGVGIRRLGDGPLIGRIWGRNSSANPETVDINDRSKAYRDFVWDEEENGPAKQSQLDLFQ